MSKRNIHKKQAISAILGNQHNCRNSLHRPDRGVWYFSVLLCLFGLTSSHAAMQTALTSDQPLNQSRIAAEDIQLERRQQDLPDLLRQLQLKANNELKAEVNPPAIASLCDSCHSRQQQQGNSYLPILQGQNQEYLFGKILLFKSNRQSRHPFPMYSGRLTNDEIMDLSIYYSRQVSDLTKTQVVPVRELGEYADQAELSINACADCHGNDGNGDQLIPAISGQNIRYLMYRIRQISRKESHIHLDTVAAVNCNISEAGLRESEILANQWAMVVDQQRASRGAEIYRDNCADCHSQGNKSAPILSEHNAWSQRLSQGTRELVKSTLIGKNDMPFWGGNIRLSRHQITDAIHYMIERISKSE